MSIAAVLRRAVSPVCVCASVSSATIFCCGCEIAWTVGSEKKNLKKILDFRLPSSVWMWRQLGRHRRFCGFRAPSFVGFALVENRIESGECVVVGAILLGALHPSLCCTSWFISNFHKIHEAKSGMYILSRVRPLLTDRLRQPLPELLAFAAESLT